MSRLLLIIPAGSEAAHLAAARQCASRLAERLGASLEFEDAEQRLESELEDPARADLIILPGDERTSKFDEHLVRRSRVPIFRCAKNGGSWSGFRENEAPNILFPTDFHYESGQVLERLIPFARKLRAAVTLFHEVPRPAGYALDFDGGAGAFQVSWEADRRERHEIAEKYANRLRVGGIATSIELSPPGRPLIESILSIVRDKRLSMIAIGARSGPIETYFTGQITKQLIRKAPCPIWVIHEKNLVPLASAPDAAA